MRIVRRSGAGYLGRIEVLTTFEMDDNDTYFEIELLCL